ncbi:chorismate synthase [Myxococcus xanthus DK 1622]|uniref:Chorismate synthase n=1 Tax=Myxococcus xanthus (strain DK1622) TaxID=246197 RepID=Q1D6K7_MYXXD|nr:MULTISPECIES: chorismate synthase [Myxococcus]ABF86059.1 chorismate synthase [Myxococcus xanthus DK 1622]NOJ51962.1 chorismate synthase [Myxococcus xanthus]QPM82937.1 chorismate synthase [Myxococcus xanthus]QVW65243.1 chorismate synthase [Myxococcus xanthus DZ2]QZZ51217.1 Chorismate synthase [Myxococcus xanthus]
MNTFGELFRLTTFGESHGPALGAILDGCPAGVPLTREQIQVALDRRRPGQSTITTARSEPDQVELLSGVFEDKTLGTPIAAIVRNTNQRSGDYEKLKAEDRPGHADAVWRERFKHRDHRGGGRTSGRETLCRVIGGAIAEAYLARDVPSIRTVAYVSQVGNLVAAVPAPGLTREQVDAHATRCPDVAIRDEMSRRILTAKEAGDSLGGAIDVRVEGLPVGLGEPIFGKLKARIAQALGSIGAVTGVVWGPPDLLERIGQPGIQFHAVKDAYGGIQGGLANGEPMQIRTFFKPPATLQEHAKGGRHDPCIMPRAVPVLEAMVSLVIADLVLHFNARPHAP